MEYGTLKFTVFTHQVRTFGHNFKLGPFLSNFGFPLVTGPFTRSDGELGFSRELVDIFELELINIAFTVLQIQDYGTYPLFFDENHNAV